VTSTYVKPTDTAHKVVVTSNIIYAVWHSSCARCGSQARIEVRTSLVGEGAAIEITPKTEKGKKLAKVSDTINRNRYVAEIKIPDNLDWGDQIYFEAKLPKHGLQMESNRIPVRPKIQVKKLAWDRKEACRGDIVKLTAEFKNLLDGTEAMMVIYEYDRDGNHDRITAFPSEIKNNKIEIEWAYEYHEDTDEIPTQEERQKYGKNYSHPEYFFVVDIDGEIIGGNQESGLLRFKDSMSLVVEDAYGFPAVKREVEFLMADGTTKTVATDNDGRIETTDVVPGKVALKIKKKQ
jgi:hypothetical protein